MKYYSLSDSVRTKAIQADKGWVKAYRGSLFPSGCNHLTSLSRFDQVVIASGQAFGDLSWLLEPDICTLDSDILLEMLGPDGMQAVNAAPLVMCGSTDRTNCLAFTAKRSVLVRGESRSTIKGACDKCGFLYYYPQPAKEPEKRYITRASLSDEAPVYNGSVGGLILREDVYQRAKKLNLRNTRLREMSILDDALDGLPADLPPYLSPERQKELGALLSRDITEYDLQWKERMANAKDIDRSGEEFTPVV